MVKIKIAKIKIKIRKIVLISDLSKKLPILG